MEEGRKDSNNKQQPKKPSDSDWNPEQTEIG